MIEDKPEIGQAGAEIEITPEMVRAAIKAMVPYAEHGELDAISLKEAVPAALRAAFQTANRDVHQPPKRCR